MTNLELLDYIKANVVKGQKPLHGLNRSDEAFTIDYLMQHADEFTLAPRTRVLNGYTVPAPLDKAPPYNSTYWVETIASSAFCMPLYWTGDSFDNSALLYGIAYATREAAIANCKARYGISQ